MEPCGGPSIAAPTYFVFEASNVSWQLESKKTGTINHTVGNTIIPRVEKKTILTFYDDK